jgi:hypothetical protein
MNRVNVQYFFLHEMYGASENWISLCMAYSSWDNKNSLTLCLDSKFPIWQLLWSPSRTQNMTSMFYSFIFPSISMGNQDYTVKLHKYIMFLFVGALLCKLNSWCTTASGSERKGKKLNFSCAFLLYKTGVMHTLFSFIFMEEIFQMFSDHYVMLIVCSIVQNDMIQIHMENKKICGNVF